jgi:hypothetical protein
MNNSRTPVLNRKGRNGREKRGPGVVMYLSVKEAHLY